MATIRPYRWAFSGRSNETIAASRSGVPILILASIPPCNTVLSRSNALPAHSARASSTAAIAWSGVAFGYCRYQCVFRREPVVEGAFGDPRVGDQIVQADLVVPVLDEQSSMRDRASRPADVGMLNDPRHASPPPRVSFRAFGRGFPVPADVGQIQTGQVPSRWRARISALDALPT